MNKVEYLKFLRDYSFCSQCLIGLYDIPNLQRSWYGTTGLAVIKEETCIEGQNHEVFYLKVVDDPGPLWIKDHEFLQRHREAWASRKVLPLYVRDLTATEHDISVSVSEAVSFMDDFLASVHFLLAASINIAESIHIKISDAVEKLSSELRGNPNYDIVSDLLSPKREHLPIVESVEAGGYIYLTGLRIKHFTSGGNKGMTILSTEWVGDDNYPDRIVYPNESFIRSWSTMHLIVRNEGGSTVDVATRDDVARFIITFLSQVESCVINDIVHFRLKEFQKEVHDLIHDEGNLHHYTKKHE